MRRFYKKETKKQKKNSLNQGLYILLKMTSCLLAGYSTELQAKVSTAVCKALLKINEIRRCSGPSI